LLVPAVGGVALLRLLLEQRLRLLLVVPEVGRAGQLIDLDYALLRAVDVKDSLGADRARLRGS
jgi:hypothetical protein